MSRGRGRILVLEDEDSQRRRVVQQFGRKHEILHAECCTTALTMVRKLQVDLLLLDLFLPDGSGWDVARVARGIDPDIAIVVMSSSKSFENAMEAFRYGALDFFPKNWRNKGAVQRLANAVEKGIRDSHVRRQARASAARIDRQQDRDNLLFVNSVGMKVVKARIEEACRSDLPVLIEGPTGSGKEVVARAVHNHSSFSSGPFVPVNVAALPHEMIESELFGHIRGSFTGAERNRAGYFEAADQGTLFLDEIVEIPPDIQVKLLRALETKEIYRVGSIRSSMINLRVIAATNQSLKQKVEEGAFREDLFFRLNAIHIQVPPLRDRREDIMPLAGHFLLSCVRRSRRDLPTDFSPEADELLLNYEWKGNVRELRNVVERIVYACDEPVVSADFIRKMTGIGTEAGQPAYPCDPGLAIKEKLRMVEARMVKEALGKTEGNISKAARLSGESYTTFRSRMKRLGLGV